MTDEQQWLALTSPCVMYFMLGEASGRGVPSDRKLRLFACACCRGLWHLLPSGRGQNIVEVAERFADGQVADGEWVRAREAAWAAVDSTPEGWDGITPVRAVAAAVSADLGGEILERATSGGHDFEAQQAAFFRDIVGNPFRPVALAPAWLTPTVTNLATAAYEERELPSGHLDPARLAVLADALEEAGADQALLAHLRSPGPHIRGCHVVDLLLDRE